MQNISFNRLTKEQYGYFLALAASSRSEDFQNPTGSVTFDQNWRTIGTGFNGFKIGFIPDRLIFEDRKKKSDLIIHAELNNILNLSKDPHFLFSVLSPCIYCSKVIAASKIKKVYFINQYYPAGKDVPDLNYVDIFNLHGIQYEQASKEDKAAIKKWHLKNIEDYLQT